MISTLVRNTAFIFTAASVLQAAPPDIRNLNNCIIEVRHAADNPPSVLTFDAYTTNYTGLIGDLRAASAHLPHVYQEVAAKPFIQFLKKLGESKFLGIFKGEASDEETATLQQIIPDVALALLSYKTTPLQGVNAFEEIVSDIYDGFLSDEARVGKQSGHPINPPTYGVIPPLVKFGSADAGPYTWPGDATRQLLGVRCGVVSLPPAQLGGGLLAWSSLGHETGGHDVTHADAGLLEELAQKVHAAVLDKFHSQALADYWARCIDETSADVCGYLHMGPSLGIGLIGYFRALGDGKLRTVGSADDPHPIDLLRGYLAAAVVKRLNFQDALAWSQAIVIETRKDNDALYLADGSGNLVDFPVTFSQAIASTDVVAKTIMRSELSSLQGHSLQEVRNWGDQDQQIVDELISVFKTGGDLPENVRGGGFYASYVVAAATQAALEQGAQVPALFGKMQAFLVQMHLDNPTWSKTATTKSTALLEHSLKAAARAVQKHTPRVIAPKLPQAVH